MEKQTTQKQPVIRFHKLNEFKRGRRLTRILDYGNYKRYEFFTGTEGLVVDCFDDDHCVEVMRVDITRWKVPKSKKVV